MDIISNVFGLKCPKCKCDDLIYDIENIKYTCIECDYQFIDEEGS